MVTDAVALEPTGSGWLIHNAAGPVCFLQGPSASAAPEVLLDWARSVTPSGLPETRCLVLLAEAGSGAVRVSAVDGRTVLVASRTLALARLAPPDWRRFVVLDLMDEPCAALVTQANGTSREDLLTSVNLGRIADLLRIVNVRHVFVRGTDESLEQCRRELNEHCGSNLDVRSTSDPRSPVLGALALAAVIEPSAGVWQTSPGQLRIAARRDAVYDLHRPERHVFSLDQDTLIDVAAGRPVFFVLDQEIDDLYGAAIHRYASERLRMVGEVVLSGRETEKTLRGVEGICRAAYAAGLRRDGIFVAVGGGVTQDMAGFAAAIFRRGVGFVRIPTTLIGLVDVAIGVKQAANAFGAKNLLGSFHPPLASILDYSFLETLPTPALSAGFAEILKMAVICDAPLFDEVEAAGPSLIATKFRSPRHAGKRIAVRAELLMAEQLATNLFEETLARPVDFGHTFSPVIETASHFRISHGEAVALDMLLSTSIAVQRTLCDPGLLNRLARVTASLSLPIWPEGMPSVAQLAGALLSARLHRGGDLNLVVPIRAGAITYLDEVTTPELERAVFELQRLAQPSFAPTRYQSLRSTGTARHASLGV